MPGHPQGVSKRTEWTREEAFRLYCLGASDYEISNWCGVSIYTVEAWKRLQGWRRRRIADDIAASTGGATVGVVASRAAWTGDGEETGQAKTRSGRRSEVKTYKKAPLKRGNEEELYEITGHIGPVISIVSGPRGPEKRTSYPNTYIPKKRNLEPSPDPEDED